MRSREEGWQERYDGRLSRTDLWGRGGEIPLRYPTHRLMPTWDTGKVRHVFRKNNLPQYMHVRIIDSSAFLLLDIKLSDFVS